MDRGMIRFNDWGTFNILIKKGIFIRAEIQKYRRNLAIFWKHWYFDVSPLRKMRKYLRAGIQAALIYQFAGTLARQHPAIEMQEYYEEKIKEIVRSTAKI